MQHAISGNAYPSMQSAGLVCGLEALNASRRCVQGKRLGTSRAALQPWPRWPSGTQLSCQQKHRRRWTSSSPCSTAVPSHSHGTQICSPRWKPSAASSRCWSLCSECPASTFQKTRLPLSDQFGSSSLKTPVNYNALGCRIYLRCRTRIMR